MLLFDAVLIGRKCVVGLGVETFSVEPWLDAVPVFPPVNLCPCGMGITISLLRSGGREGYVAGERGS